MSTLTLQQAIKALQSGKLSESTRKYIKEVYNYRMAQSGLLKTKDITEELIEPGKTTLPVYVMSSSERSKAKKAKPNKEVTVINAETGDNYQMSPQQLRDYNKFIAKGYTHTKALHKARLELVNKFRKIIKERCGVLPRAGLIQGWLDKGLDIRNQIEVYVSQKTK